MSVKWQSVYEIDKSGMSEEVYNKVTESLNLLQNTQEGQRLLQKLFDSNDGKTLKMQLGSISAVALYNSDINAVLISEHTVLQMDAKRFAQLLGHETEHAGRRDDIERMLDDAPSIGREYVARDFLEFSAQNSANKIARELGVPEFPYASPEIRSIALESLKKSKYADEAISSIASSLVGNGELARFINDKDNAKFAEYLQQILPQFSKEEIKRVLDGPSTEAKRLEDLKLGTSTKFSYSENRSLDGAETSLTDGTSIALQANNQGTPSQSDDTYLVAHVGKDGKAKTLEVKGAELKLDGKDTIKSQEVADIVRAAWSNAASDRIFSEHEAAKFAELRSEISSLAKDGKLSSEDISKIGELAAQITPGSRSESSKLR